MPDLLTRAATFEPSTFNAENNTVEVVFSTGADVVRYDLEGQFIERLDMSAAAVNLAELRGAPVLNNHDRFSGVEAILGVVEEAAVDGKRGVARVRFGARPEVQGIATDVRSGVIRNVSAGYTVQEWRTTKENGARVKVAVRWTPKEISFTPLAADPQAKTRSIGDSMEKDVQIRSIAEAVGVSASFADGLIQQNTNVDEARAAIIREAARYMPAIDNRQPAAVTRDADEDLIPRMADGLLARINPAHKPTAGREFANARMSDIARRCLEARGLSVMGSPVELLTRALHSTSDFSNVLAEVFNKSLSVTRTAPPAIQRVFKSATAADFRARHTYEISDGPGLQKVGESGEITYGSISDKALASYSISSYGKVFGISFNALVNDDMNALGDLSGKMTRGARSWFAGFLADTIIANPTLSDSTAVFHANHGNLAGSGAAPSDVTLAAAKLAMRKQVDVSGNPVDAVPQFLVIPAALETTVDKLLATLYPQVSNEAETAARGLTPIIEPRLDLKSATTAWYLFADPSIAPVFEYAELQGYEGPRVEVRQGFETLGTEVRVVWHVGAGAIDFKGAYKNAGA